MCLSQIDTCMLYYQLNACLIFHIPSGKLPKKCRRYVQKRADFNDDFFLGNPSWKLPNFSGNHMHFMDFIYLLGFPPGWAKVRLPVADHFCSFQFSKESLQVANSNDKAERSYKGMGPRLVIVTSSGAISNPYKWPKIHCFQRVFLSFRFFDGVASPYL